ncbi:EamA family transporter [bacterium]|nr:EamA family transporter [bacterium]
MSFSIIALVLRIIGLGFERPLVKALGQGRSSIAATTLYFGIGILLLLPVIIWQASTNPLYFADIHIWILPCVASGLIYALSFHTYVYAMSVGEVSYLTPLYATAFLFLYLLDIVFGTASFGLVPLGGILVVMLGVVLLNLKPGADWHKSLNPLLVVRQPGAWGMLVYAFGLATGRLIDKSVANIAPPVAYAFLDNLPAVLIGAAILLFRGRLSDVMSLHRERTKIAWVGAVSGMGAYVMLLLALRDLKPSVVEPVTQLSVFIAVGMGGLWFGEQTRTRWLPSLLLVVGAVLLLWKG